MALHPVPSALFQITALIRELFENKVNLALLRHLLLLHVLPFLSLSALLSLTVARCCVTPVLGEAC